MSNAIFPATSQPMDLNLNRYTAQYDRLDNYNDLNALQSIKYQSKSDKSGALDAAAKHFESIFVSMMIKSMRDANKVFSEGNMLNSSESEFYQQMFDSQLSVSLATGKGIGLAEVIKRQLSKDLNTPSLDIPPEGLPLSGSARAGASDSAKTFSLENYARLPFVSSQKVSALDETVQSIEKMLETLPVGAAEPATVPEVNSIVDKHDSQKAATAAVRFGNPQDFIASLYPYAKDVEQKTGIDARLMLAQSALETGWGKYPILKADGQPSFNLFGIKSHADWQGDSANITTTEYRGGVAMTEKANFRAYASYQESFHDYAHFLKSNTRYQDALNHVDQPKEFAEKLQQAGYATDPNYADKINQIMDRYMIGLDKLDVPEAEGPLQNMLRHSVPGEKPVSRNGQEG